MEELALETQLAGAPVDAVAGDGEVDRGEVDPDLVRTAGLERDPEECVAVEELLDLEVRHRRTRRVRVEECRSAS